MIVSIIITPDLIPAQHRFLGVFDVMFAFLATDNFFRPSIDHMIDLRHPLVVLASHMPWIEIETRLAPVFSRKAAPVW